MSKKRRTSVSSTSTKGNENSKLPMPMPMPMRVRKSLPGELFYPTGRAELRYCVYVQERVSRREILRHEFMPVTDPVFGPLGGYAEQVLFREAVSDDGERFAYPQILYNDWSTPEDWRNCEKEAFENEPIGHWLVIERCPEGNGYHYGVRPVEKDEVIDCQDFATALEEALQPNAITGKDHPMYRRLAELSGIEEDDFFEVHVEAAE